MEAFIPASRGKWRVREQRSSAFWILPKMQALWAKAAGRPGTQGIELSINPFPSLQSSWLCYWCWPKGVPWTQQTWKASHRGQMTLGMETHLWGLTDFTCVQLHLRWEWRVFPHPESQGPTPQEGQQKAVTMAWQPLESLSVVLG